MLFSEIICFISLYVLIKGVISDHPFGQRDEGKAFYKGKPPKNCFDFLFYILAPFSLFRKRFEGPFEALRPTEQQDFLQKQKDIQNFFQAPSS